MINLWFVAVCIACCYIVVIIYADIIQKVLFVQAQYGLWLIQVENLPGTSVTNRV